MRTTILIGILVALAPAAAATGWLVNVEVGSTPIVKYGLNPLGGQGDFIDVGVANNQCSDEEDVVDVGVFNAEGTCWAGNGCVAEEGQPDFLSQFLVNSGIVSDPSTHPHSPHCSDDRDVVDVGLLNSEGEPNVQGSAGDREDVADAGILNYENVDTTDGTDVGAANHEDSDWDDGNDAGVLNQERSDDADHNDVGVVNCEYSDGKDTLDVGVLNAEYWYDGGDTLDLSILNYEENDPVDGNGLNVANIFGFQVGCLSVFGPVGPGGVPASLAGLLP